MSLLLPIITLLTELAPLIEKIANGQDITDEDRATVKAAMQAHSKAVSDRIAALPGATPGTNP